MHKKSYQTQLCITIVFGTIFHESVFSYYDNWRIWAGIGLYLIWKNWKFTFQKMSFIIELVF